MPKSSFLRIIRPCPSSCGVEQGRALGVTNVHPRHKGIVYVNLVEVFDEVSWQNGLLLANVVGGEV
jgi:hypothetical protein